MFIRNFLEKEFSSTFISRILIKRKFNDYLVVVYLSKNELFSNQSYISELSKNLNLHLVKKFSVNLASLNIIEPSNLNISAGYVADSIKNQLEKRIVFRKAIKTALSKLQQGESTLKGIKIQIAGRLNGAEIARTEWVREGRIPLNTLKANIDYAYTRALVFLICILYLNIV